MSIENTSIPDLFRQLQKANSNPSDDLLRNIMKLFYESLRSRTQFTEYADPDFDLALTHLKKSQQIIDQGRGTYVHIGSERHRDTRESEHQVPVSTLPRFVFFDSSESHYLLLYAASELYFQEKLTNIYQSLQKNGWESKRKKIEKALLNLSRWFDEFKHSQVKNLNILPSVSKDSAIVTKDKFISFAHDDLKTTISIMEKKWPTTEIAESYLSRKKSQIIFPSAIFALNQLLLFGEEVKRSPEFYSNKNKVLAKSTILIDFLNALGVETDLKEFKNHESVDRNIDPHFFYYYAEITRIEHFLNAFGLL